jgi:hypothetical protein
MSREKSDGQTTSRAEATIRDPQAPRGELDGGCRCSHSKKPKRIDPTLVLIFFGLLGLGFKRIHVQAHDKR